MAIDDKIRNEKLQYDINREASKISVLLYGKIDKQKYITDEEVPLSDHTRVIKQKTSGFNQ